MRHQQVIPAMILAALAALAGCEQARMVNIRTRPPGALVRIDGQERGRTPLNDQEIIFRGANDTHTITLAHQGYKEESILINLDAATRGLPIIELKPATRRVTISVEPLPGVISIDDRPVAEEPQKSWSGDLEFTADGKGNWTSHKVTVERPGFRKAEAVISGADKSPEYTITLAALEKDLTILTTPAGAHVYLDGEAIGKSPLTEKGRKFTTDPVTMQWSTYKLRLIKPGYEPVEATVGWDDGKADYSFDLKARAKTVRIVSDPAGATVAIDGKELARDKEGQATATLSFEPDDRGNEKVYEAIVTRKTAVSEYHPGKVTIKWDDGKTDYPVKLAEVRTVTLDLLSVGFAREKAEAGQAREEGWRPVPIVVKTVAWKDTGEPARGQQPERLYVPAKGAWVDSMAPMPPKGDRLVFSAIAQDGTDLRGTLHMIGTDGKPETKDVLDSKGLDLMPSFTPDGADILFSSNRGGKRMSICKISTSGAGGIQFLTTGDTNDLWPSLDPQKRLFYQGLVDTRADARLFQMELGKVGRTDLVQSGGLQPRISPDNTKLLYTARNGRTGKREIFVHELNPKDSTPPVNLTNNPDSDNFDASWSRDGRRIVFVSDRGVDEEKRNNYDIWVLDLAQPGKPIQLTTNGSWDDAPVWSPAGDAVFFRSNRGGEWAIWKLPLSRELSGQ